MTYQSVMAQRQGIGSSGVGFAFATVTIKEVHPETNICLGMDMSANVYQLGINKRGIEAWPQVGDTWLIDRSMGHWALRTKITDNEAPVMTGNFSTMDPDVLRLVTILKGLGLVQDGTTAGSGPALDTWTEVSTLISPFSNYNTATYQGFRYMLGSDKFVRIEGLIKASATLATGTNPIFQLPSSDYFPAKNQVFASQANGNLCLELVITSTGLVQFGTVPASTSISFATVGCQYSVLP